MILNKLAVFKDAAAKTPTLPVFTVMSLQTAFSVAFVMRDRRKVTRRIALQWLPVCRPVFVVRLRLPLSAFCRLRFFLSPCSVLGAISLLFAFTLSLGMIPAHLPAPLPFQ
jgi:hypothetical protein